MARQELFGAMYSSGRPPRELIRRTLAEHPVQLERYRAGKRGLPGFLVGKVMRASGGKADPRKVNELLRKEVE